MGDFPLTSVGAEGKTVGLVTQAQTWDLFLSLMLLANRMGATDGTRIQQGAERHHPLCRSMGP